MRSIISAYLLSLTEFLFGVKKNRPLDAGQLGKYIIVYADAVHPRNILKPAVNMA